MPAAIALNALRRLFPTPESRAFLRWGTGAYVLTTAVVLVWSLRLTGGQLVYALDDPAIHLSMARNLVDHGTWGVTPGVFQSASSSPLWTVLLSGFVAVAPSAANAAPLIFNLVAAVAIIAILARVQSVLRPTVKRPLDVAAVTVIVVFVLFLPAATLVGMEHLFHAAVLLLGFHLMRRPPAVDRPAWSRLLPYVCIALATLVRIETAFVAAGLGTALLVTVDRRRPDALDQLKRRLAAVAGLGLASGVPLVAWAAVNRAMGQGVLPNSVLAKSRSLNSADEPFIPDAIDIFNRFTGDPMLAVLVGLCVALVVLGWRDRRSWVAPALAVAIATLLHATFADVGWYERYQIYLIALAVSVLLVAASELLPHRGPIPVRSTLVPGLAVVLLLFSATKVSLTVEAPHAVEDTFAQRYQAARFLQRYYDGEPIATGELGYISLRHDGPITDLLGLGDHAVLTARRDIPPDQRQRYWTDLARQRGFAVVAMYPRTLLLDTPDEWILVGSWTLRREAISAFERQFQFWATRPEEVAPLKARLEEFERELPSVIEFRLNELAEYRADVLIKERDAPR